MKLIFIHTPKCGGSYVSQILSDLNITNRGHNQADINNNGEINFTIIRHPVERFESLLNYRLQDAEPRDDWPKHLNYVYSSSNMDLNTIIDKMSDNNITGFWPYNSLTYWGKNIDVFLLIDQLQSFLNLHGYTYDTNKYNKINVSTKIRGTLNDKNKERIAKLYSSDMELFNLHSNNK